MSGQYAAKTRFGHPTACCARTPLRHARFAYVFMLMLLWPMLSWPARALTPPPDTISPLGDDCDATASVRVLSRSPDTRLDARAYWLDRQHLQWPGAQSTKGERYRLHHAANAQLRAAIGEPVRGSDAAITLSVSDVPLSASLRERFAFIGDGVHLQVPVAHQAALQQWLRGQVLLTRETADGRVLDATYVQLPGLLDDVYASAEGFQSLGAQLRPAPQNRLIGDTVDFAIWAPTARSVAVCLYPQRADDATTATPLRRDNASGVWSMSVAIDRHQQAYTYLVDVFVPGVGIVRNRVTDPYSVALTADSKRSLVLNLDAPDTKPDGWDQAFRPQNLAAQTDLSIYELHVRDFSIGDRSVREAWRGKYLAFTEAHSAGMRHLRALREAGMTDVHLLPVFDLATVPETQCITPHIPKAAADSEAPQAAVTAVADRDCFNWGYDPYHFNVPEGSYATRPDDGAARTREFRAMVMALHRIGLRVGMDVVYNHTTASGQHEKSVLDRIVPGYYHRLNAKGEVERSTCCDNTATEHRMMAKLMIESAALWAKHYRIDSFRFDLMGHQPRAAMARLQTAVNAAAQRHVQLIGEGWNFGEVADGKRFMQASQNALQDSGIATFSDRARDALRGGGCCDSGDALFANQGLLSGLHFAPNAYNRSADAATTRMTALRAADLARIGLAGTLRDYSMQAFDGDIKPLSQFDYAGQAAGYAAQPSEVVNYVENHDNPTLFDILALKLPRDTTREARTQVQLLGAAFVAFSQGVAYYHAGIDVLRSKSLDRNSFDSGDWFNRIDWTYADNGFGAGLPPSYDNGKDWALLKPVLRDTRIKPTTREIVWMRDAFRDLLRIRASSTLFRMRSAEDVQQRLSFRNTGPQQNVAVIAAHLDGRDYPGAGFAEVLYAINVSPEAQTITLPEEVGKPYRLHPVQADARATDRRPRRDARYIVSTGAFVVPARTAVVYVIE